MITKFKIFEEVEFFGADIFPDTNFFEPKKEKEDIFKKDMIEIAKKGKLYNQLASGKRLTFGVLKAFHHDILKFKEHREYLNAAYKFLHRMIPLALAPMFFPIWVISQFLGFTRAVNKIIIPVMRMKRVRSGIEQDKKASEKIENDNYITWIQKIIIKALDAAEGDIKRFSDDWFYKAFAVEKGLLKMVDHDVLLKFAYELSIKMDKKPDYEPVPPYYVENELRKYLNREFNLDPKLSLKRKSN